MSFKKEKKEVITIPPLTREEIKDFERELENFKSSVHLEQPIEFYGQLVTWCSAENRELSHEEAEQRGLIVNPIIGGAHASVIAYALINNIISKKDDCWYLIGRNWDEFNRKWKALKELKEARAFANRVNTPPVDLKELKENIAKDFGPEDSLESIDDLPF